MAIKNIVNAHLIKDYSNKYIVGHKLCINHHRIPNSYKVSKA